MGERGSRGGKAREISRFRHGIVEDFTLLVHEYYAVWVHRRRNFFWNSLILEDWTDMLSRNVGKQTKTLCHVTSQQSEGLKTACGNLDRDFVTTTAGLLRTCLNWSVPEARRN